MSLARLPKIIGFFSYAHDDDGDGEPDSDKPVSQLRRRIEAELRVQLGRPDLQLWQDHGIPKGSEWEKAITQAIGEATFLIPLVTPTSVGRDYCTFELEAFRKREKALGRSDLIFPIHYIRVHDFDDEPVWRADPVLSLIRTRQCEEWWPVRHQSLDSPAMKEKLIAFCGHVVDALRRAPPQPDEANWARIKDDGDAQAIRDHIAAFPGSKTIPAARERLEALEWEALPADATAEKLEAFLKEFPDGQHAADARRRLRELQRQEQEVREDKAWRKASAAGTVQALEAFLSEYPDGAHAADARKMLQEKNKKERPQVTEVTPPDRESWERIQTSGSADGNSQVPADRTEVPESRQPAVTATQTNLRRLLIAAFGLVALIGVVALGVPYVTSPEKRGSSQPSAYPDRPVTMVVAFSPGGATDISARLLASALESSLGQPFVIENIAGGAGEAALQRLRNARPDGYTLLMWTSRLGGIGRINAAAVATIGKQDDSLVGLVAPAQTPNHQIEKLNAAVNQALKSPTVTSGLSRAGIQPRISSPSEAARAMQ